MIFWLMNVFMWSEGNFDLQSRWSCDECWSRFYTRKFNIFFWKLLVHMWKCDICLWKASFVSWSDERSHPDTFLKSSSGNFLKKHLIASSSLSSWLQSAVVTSLLQTHTRWKMAEHLGIFCRMNARVRFTSGAALCGQMNQKINFFKNKISCLYTRSLINSSCAWTVDWISPRVCRRINSSAKCAAISAGAEGELLSLSQSRSLHNFIQEVSEWVSEWQKPPRCCSLSHISVHDWLTFTEGNAIMWKIRWEECVGWWAGSEAPALSGYHIPQSASYFRPPSSSIRSFPTCTKRPSSNTHGLMWLSSQPFGV